MTESGLYVYVSHQRSRHISVLRMSPASGELSRVQDISVTGRVMPLAVSPDRRFLFAGLRSEPYSIASFAIDGSNGMLTHLWDAPAAESTPYICPDRTGRFLFAAYNPSERSRRTGSISVSAIGAHGYVQAPHQLIRSTSAKLHATSYASTVAAITALPSACTASASARTPGIVSLGWQLARARYESL